MSSPPEILPSRHSRLKQQGFSNLHRKKFFRLLAAGLLAMLLFIPDPWRLSSRAALACQIAGTLLVFAGILGRIMATISIGGQKDRTIVATELYSVCRNPLYFASFLMAAGIGLLSARVDFLALATTGYLAIFYPMMRNEADYLRRRFADYAEYERRVPLFLPDFRLWQERHHFEINFRLVRRTLLDAAVALPVIPLMYLIRHFT